MIGKRGKVQQTEQWLLKGNCKKCRKRKYCSKPCTKHKRFCKSELQEIVAEATFKRMLKNN